MELRLSRLTHCAALQLTGCLGMQGVETCSSIFLAELIMMHGSAQEFVDYSAAALHSLISEVRGCATMRNTRADRKNNCVSPKCWGSSQQLNVLAMITVLGCVVKCLSVTSL